MFKGFKGSAIPLLSDPDTALSSNVNPGPENRAGAGDGSGSCNTIFSPCQKRFIHTNHTA